MTGVRAIGFVLLLTVPAFAREPKLKLTWIQAAPGDFILAGKWASQRIVVTGKLPDGTLRDVTGQTQFKSSNSKVAAVTKSGVVTPVADGEANIELNANGKKQKLHVTVKGSRTQSAAFLTEVRPLLSKLGCNYRAVSRRGARQRRAAPLPIWRRRRIGFRGADQGERRPPHQPRRPARQPPIPQVDRRSRSPRSQSRNPRNRKSCSPG